MQAQFKDATSVRMTETATQTVASKIAKFLHLTPLSYSLRPKIQDIKGSKFILNYKLFRIVQSNQCVHMPFKHYLVQNDSYNW
jgi:hypothetical protein